MKRIINYIVPFFFLTAFAGCYTQVATQDTSESYTRNVQEESQNYYSDEYSDSGYTSEGDELYADGATIINNYYYGYPSYRRYYGYYYPSIVIGIGYTYYPYYYPYYWGYSWGGWCGYWYYPCFYPYYSFYYGYPYYYYPGNYGYNYTYYSPSYYKTRSNYVSGLRNNSGGGRGYGIRTRDLVTTTSITANQTTSRVRDLSGTSRDLSAENSSLNVSRTRTNNTNTLGVSEVRNTSDNDRRRSSEIKSTEQVGLVDQNETKRTERQLGSTRTSNNTERKKYLGSSRDTDSRTLGVPKSNNTRTDKNVTGRTGNTYSVPKKDSESKGTTRTGDSRSNDRNVQSSPNKNNSNDRNSNTPKQYTPPKSNETPRSYTPPSRSNTNDSPRSYSPPSNNTPRSSTPPSSGGGGGSSRSGDSNSGGSRR